MNKILLVYSSVMINIGFSSLSSAQSTTITPGDKQPSIVATSTNSGVVVPKIVLTGNLNSASPVSSPTEGLLAYNVGTNQIKGFYYWTGAAWQSLGASVPLSAASPISISSNTIRLNAGTAAGQLLSWDGNNWINTNPKPDATLNNYQPYLAVNYCIALQGVFPQRDGLDPFIGEISIFGFGFAPRGWALCNGQLLSISQNTALFSLLGIYYGGNAQTTFALPDLRGRTPIHYGSGPGLNSFYIGQQDGVSTHTIQNKY